MSEKIKKLGILFSEKEMQRLGVGDNELKVDVHGMNCREAMQFLKNIVALISGTLTIEVIHGYTHGYAIKNMLRNDFISPRVIKTESIDWNPGVTRIIIA